MPTKAEQWKAQREREDRAARQAAIAFLIAIAAAIGLIVVYFSGDNTQLEGILLFISFGSVGAGLAIWAKVILDEPLVVEPRPPMRSADEYRKAFEQTYEEGLGDAEMPRRRFLFRLLAGASVSLGIALLLPLASLGPGPSNDLFRTRWAAGKRLVTVDGEPLRPEQIGEDQVVTVFPEGVEPLQAADSQALLIGVRRDLIDLPAGSPDPIDGNIVVYSKVCTHAGCPVGLYRAKEAELLCPCHQSTFDVARGGEVVFGPAGRPLPMLPIGVDDAGFLIALGDFTAPIGPSFWNMTRDVEEA